MSKFSTIQWLSAELPDGERISVKDLPPADTSRWVASRKAAVAKAVIAGLIEEGEAIARYQLSEEELKGWVSAYQRQGEDSLKLSKRFQT